MSQILKGYALERALLAVSESLQQRATDSDRIPYSTLGMYMGGGSPPITFYIPKSMQSSEAEMLISLAVLCMSGATTIEDLLLIVGRVRPVLQQRGMLVSVVSPTPPPKE